MSKAEKIPGMNDALNYGILENNDKKNKFDINKVDYDWVAKNTNVKELK